MKGYDPLTTFDEASAEGYDSNHVRGDEAETVAFLAHHARGGAVLELAIGTGRIALPLATTGLRVDGIDSSEPMVAKLRAKPGGVQLAVTMGDFADVDVPGYLHALRDRQYVDAEAVGVHEVRLDVARHDPVAQLLEESHVVLSASGVRLFPIVTRYAWPSELDLMARVAGLRLRERWGGWSREPFTATSANCVSVYGR